MSQVSTSEKHDAKAPGKEALEREFSHAAAGARGQRFAFVPRR